MKGLIYRVALKHRFIDPHPHLVVLVVGKQCFVVPGYSPGKPAVTDAKDALLSMGWPPDKISIPLDNAKHVTPLSNFTWHQCEWFIAQAYWTPRSEFSYIQADGEMDAAGINAIVRGLLQLAEDKDELFDERALQLLSNLLSDDADDSGKGI